jgi:signal peptidase II
LQAAPWRGSFYELGYNSGTNSIGESILKKIARNYLFLFSIAGVVVILDQIAKALVRAYIPLGGTWMPLQWLAPYARIVYIYNTGVAFGMFQNLGSIFLVLALIISVAMIYYFPRVPQGEWVQRVAMSLMLGGALGNLIDRILFNNRVTDFISVGNFAIFNIADSSITVGVAVLLLGIWLQEQREKKETSERAVTEAPQPQDGDQTLER